MLDIWSILIIIIAFQGLFMLSVLVFSRERRSRRGTAFLCFIIIALIWYLCEFFSIRHRLNLGANFFYGTRYGSWLLLGPLTYFYFKAISGQDWKFNLKRALHLLPFLVLVIFIPTFSGDSLSIRQINYGMLAVFDHRPKVVTGYEYLYSSVFFLQFIHLAVYLIINLFNIKAYAKQLKREYANINQLIWLKVFNWLLMATLILSSGYLYLLFRSDAYNRFLDYIYVLPMGLFIYAVGYRLSGINWLPVSAFPQDKKYQSSNLKESEKSSYIEQLEKLMIEEKPYLNNDLRIKTLADKLAIPHHHLSQLINEHYQHSFFDYINQYRIEESKRLIQNNPELKLLQVAFDSGFNNKTSFVNAFKKFEGQTPSGFRDQQSN